MKVADKDDILESDDGLQAIPCPSCLVIIAVDYDDGAVENVERCKYCNEEFEIF